MSHHSHVNYDDNPLAHAFSARELILFHKLSLSKDLCPLQSGYRTGLTMLAYGACVSQTFKFGRCPRSAPLNIYTPHSGQALLLAKGLHSSGLCLLHVSVGAGDCWQAESGRGRNDSLLRLFVDLVGDIDRLLRTVGVTWSFVHLCSPSHMSIEPCSFTLCSHISSTSNA